MKNSQAALAELRIAKLLRSGVFLAGLCIAIGLLTSVIAPDATKSSWTHLTNYENLAFTTHIQQLVSAHDWGQLICYGGLLILISLPILRVFLTAFIFIRSREYVLAGLAFFVFFILVLSFILGIELT